MKFSHYMQANSSTNPSRRFGIWAGLLGAALGVSTALMSSLALAGSEQGSAQQARIITGNERAAECISSVHVNTIDGQQVFVQRLGFDIEPGKHTVMARTLVNNSFCAAIGPGTNRDTVEPLEAEFEAGKTYYLGYDHSSGNRRDWKLVIWKVEG